MSPWLSTQGTTLAPSRGDATLTRGSTSHGTTSGRGPFLLGSYHAALTLAFVVVGVELIAIAYIRYRYFSMNFFMSVLQVVVGGMLVFASGVLIGSRG